MTSDRDIWASAKLYVDQHGADASVRAAKDADEFAAKGDLEGEKTWRRIITAIEWFRDNRGRDPFKVEH